MVKKLLLALSVLALVGSASVAAQPDDAAGLAAAWARAQAAGSYALVVDVAQTVLPAATPKAIGQSESRLDWRLEGAVRLPDQAVLTLRAESGVNRAAPVGVVQQGGQTFVEQRGRYVSSASPAVGLPSADYLSFLAAAREVRALPPETVGGHTFNRYAFLVDGSAYARHIADTLARTQGVPPGLQLTPPDTLTHLSGTGEAWVDAQGLPRRLTLDLRLPPTGEGAEALGSVAQVTVDFSQFGQVGALPTLQADGQGAWQLVQPPAAAGKAVFPASESWLAGPAHTVPVLWVSVSLVLLVAWGMMARRHRRAAHLTLTVLVIVALVASPVLQGVGVHLFSVRNAQAAPAANPLAAALGLAETDLTAAQAQQLIASRLRPASANSIEECGDGSGGVDSDQDGLTDLEESCLGTDPFDPDTDGDTITDTLEITGFALDGQTWTTDPFNADSNLDGMSDASEWPAPVGLAVNADLDGDGIPNLWDDDDDGDGVSDQIDISPHAFTGYTNRFDLQTQGGGFTGYQYITLQLQPQNPNRWRYTVSPLDWPQEDQGQIVDLDGGADDIRLVPLLEIEANVQPSAFLADKYGVVPAGKLYVPLLPVSDGGRITAFQAKVAYAPGELDNIQWNNMRFLWAVQGETDTYINCRDEDQSAANCDIHSEPALLQFYQETFRVTGLQIKKSGNYEVAVLGTPYSPTEDTDLFRLLFGLGASFMPFYTLEQQANSQTALQEVEERLLNVGSTPITYTWGVTRPVAFERVTYTHEDEGQALTTSDLVPNFLQTHFPDGVYSGDACVDAAGNTFMCASLGIAVEQQTGVFDLSILGTQVNASTISVNLNTVDMVTQRGVRLAMFDKRGPMLEWNPLSPERMLEIIEARYPQARLESILADLMMLYPDITVDDLRFANVLVYTAQTVGQTRTLAVNGLALESRSQEVAATVAESLGVGRNFAVDVPAFAMSLTDGSIKEDFKLNFAKTSHRVAYAAMAITAGVAIVGTVIMGAIRLACAVNPDQAVCKNEQALKIASAVFTGLTAITVVLSIAQTIKAAKAAGTALTTASAASKATVVLAVIGLIIDLGLNWTIFGLTLANADGNPMIINVAIATIVVSTIWSVTLFILALIVPVGTIIAGILALIDAIISIATLGDWSVSRIIVELFYTVKLQTELKTVEFTNLQSSLLDPQRGPIVDNRYLVEDTFRATLGITNNADIDKLDSSYAKASFQGISTAWVFAQNQNGDYSCVVVDETATCTNDVAVRFSLDLPFINASLTIHQQVDYVTTYTECGVYGTICETTRTIESSFVVPDTSNDSTDDDEALRLYVDILPTSPDDLFNLTGSSRISPTIRLGAPDRDMDGVRNAVDTAPDNWDRDNDGIPDGFEIDNATVFGINPDSFDADGDGLSDRFELLYGTKPNVADTDGDGLLDGEEVFHRRPDGTWAGGWDITLPGGRVVRVFSDPLRADVDNDGLTDRMERDNGLSPYAFNGAPRLTLQAAPLRADLKHGSGLSGWYVAPAEAVTVTVTVRSSGPRPITSTVSICLPTELTGVSVGAMRGVTAQNLGACATGTRWGWNFAGNNALTIGETISATVRATVNPVLTTSLSRVVEATLPYTPDTYIANLNLVVDADAPSASLTAPLNGAFLRGMAYVIGGNANDPTSWVDTVEVDTGAGFEPANGASPWATTWMLPADGVYTVRARALDPFGRASALAQATVTVDNTPPTVTLQSSGGYLSGDARTITFTGAATDNLSGVDRVQVSVAGQPWRETTFESGAWTYTWQAGNRAQGRYDVAVRAFDRAGNVSPSLKTSVIVDRLAPTDDLTSRLYLDDVPQVAAGSPLTLTGRANDAGNAPLPPRPEPVQGNLDALTSATLWLAPDSVREDDAGVRAVWLGDINGDALADLALGFPAAHAGGGRVAFIYGRGGGWRTPPDVEAIASTPSSMVGVPGAGLGALVASAGDVNADGFFDVLIGDPQHNRVFLVFGRPGDVGSNQVLTGTENTNWQVILTPPGPRLVAPAGDVNGDGFDDVLVGAGNTAYLILGVVDPFETIDAADRAAAFIALPANGTITGVGDVTGDLLDDWAVSDPTGTQAVYLFAGRSTLIAKGRTPFALTVNASNALAALGGVTPGQQIVALGDTNGDDLSDFIYTTSAGPRLVLGRASGAWTHTVQFDAYTPAATGLLAAPGDLNADGLNDVVIGHAGGGAYVFFGQPIWPAAPNIAATLSDVGAVASAPYAAGADLNCDASSDLLIIPGALTALTERTELAFGETTQLPASQLPRAPEQPSTVGGQGARALLALNAPEAGQFFFVDDDYCAGCINDGRVFGVDAFADIQAAVNAAGASDEITVLPGRYLSFTVGTGKQNLVIRGVNADAVFVDGGGGLFAVHITGTVGVRLHHLTLQNAERALWLAQAGVGGHLTPTLQIQAERVLFRAFTHAVYADRVSTLYALDSTMAGQPASLAYVALTGAPDPAFDRTWTTQTASLTAFGPGGDLVTHNNQIFALHGGGSSAFSRFDPTTNVWTARAALPEEAGPGSVLANGNDGFLYLLRGGALGGGVNGTIQAVAVSGNDVYVGGVFSQATNADGTVVAVSNLARWNGVNWSNVSSGVNGPVHALVFSGTELYVGGQFTLAGGSVPANNVARWNGTAWSAVGSPINGVNGRVQALAVGNGRLFVGGNFTSAGGVRTDSLAVWTGTAWDRLGAAFAVWNGPVTAIQPASGGDVYVAGNFTLAHGVPANRVARWNNTLSSWASLGTGLNNAAYALALEGSNLYVGGMFTTAGGATANRVARWNIASPGWSALGTGTGGPVFALAVSGSQVVAGGAFRQMGGVVGADYLARWNGTTWQAVNGAPGARPETGAQALAVRALAVNGADVYQAGVFNQAGGVETRNLTLVSAAYRYNIASNTWSAWNFSGAAPAATGAGAQLAADGNTFLYAVAGLGSRTLYRYAIAATTWTALTTIPDTLGRGSTLALVGGQVYLLRGGGTSTFYRYDPVNIRWTVLPSAPLNINAGASLAWDGRDYLYATAGGNGLRLMRFSLSDEAWDTLPDITPGTFLVGEGSGLALAGNRLFLTQGNGQTAFNAYGSVGVSAQKLTFDRVAFVAPPNIGAVSWLNQSNVRLNDVEVAGSGSVWVGDAPLTWSPANPSASNTAALAGLPRTLARFVNPAVDVYRVESNSVLAAGYHTARPDAYVSPNYCPTCANDGRVWGVNAFNSVQAAIDSGAVRVLLQAGVYPQRFYLVNGLTLAGVSAAEVILQPPAGPLTTPLALAESLDAVTLARFTLNGDGRASGLRVEDGARAFKFTRSIVRDTSTAIGLAGVNTTAELVNLTLVDNGRGVLAEACAPVDVRNTILAGHGQAALTYAACAPSQLHRYNLYWANAQDYVVDGAPVQNPGPGEIALDPLFVNPSVDDYRLLSTSPAIGAGNPTDPTPPGTGGRVDMGYAQSGQAALYADDDYCATCTNDGLLWQVDAFDRVQDALNAADSRVRALGQTFNAPVLTVGVGPGVYAENLRLPSYIRLIGSGAEQTTLQGVGGGSVVVISGTVHAAVRGFTLRGAGPTMTSAGVLVTNRSSNITLAYNLFNANPLGVSVANDANAIIHFNTFVNHSVAGVRVAGAASWAEARNNILANNLFGLQTQSGGKLFSDFNLLDNVQDLQIASGTQLLSGSNDLLDTNPLFANPAYELADASPAVDSADPLVTPPTGGGQRADRGYRELLAVPITILLGREGNSCTVGNVGVTQVEVGLAPVADLTDPLTATLPSVWTLANLTTPGQTASYWSAALTPPTAGFYRLYSRATDALGNAETNPATWFNGTLIADASPPELAWHAPADGLLTTEAAITASVWVSDVVFPGYTAGWSVASVYFDLDGAQVWPAQWTGAELNGAREYLAIIPLADGAHTLTPVARDRAGNTASAPARTVTAQTPAPVATLTSFPNGFITSQPTLTVEGYARFTGTLGTGVVQIQVNGGSPISANLETPASALSFWSAQVPLGAPGAYTLTLTALRVGALVEAVKTSSLTLFYDNAPPTLTVSAPVNGGIFTETVTVRAQAADAISGLAGVSASFDGGASWLPLAFTGVDWALTWTVPFNDAHLNYPVRVRATDGAGNTQVDSRAIVVDNVPPLGVAPVAFAVPEGTHLDAPQTLAFTWTVPQDGNDFTALFAQVSQIDQAPATAPVSGTTLLGALNAPGTWWTQLRVADGAQNQWSRQYGPWYVGTVDAAIACNARRQTISINGALAVPQAEWRTDRELLAHDWRSGRQQSLYATWDGAAFYLGWQGAWWSLDGTLFAYLDALPGGLNAPVDGTDRVLPLLADYAFEVSGPGTGRLWQVVSGAWQPSGTLDFVHNDSGGTEIRLPWNAETVNKPVRLLAYALDDTGAAWSVFPTSNRLDRAWTDTYIWADPCATTAPNANQPQGPSALFTLTSPQPTLAASGPNQPLQYVARVVNQQNAPLAGLQLQFAASERLAYYTLEGATCTACIPGDPNWLFTLPTLNPLETRVITLTGELGSDLNGVRTVTTTAVLRAPNALTLDQAQVVHRVDGEAPNVAFSVPPANTVRAGEVTLFGTASDGDGGGLGQIRWREVSATVWQTATVGTLWGAQTLVPDTSPTYAVEAQAVDVFGHASAIARHIYRVDVVSPTVDFALPPMLTGTTFAVLGVARDPDPTGSAVRAVEVRLDAASERWLPADGPSTPDVSGDQIWGLTWALPPVDGVTFTVQARAFDLAGNLGLSPQRATYVDTLGPMVTVTTALTQVLAPAYSLFDSGAPVLVGAVTDASGVQAVRVRLVDAQGVFTTTPASLTGAIWAYTPTALVPGDYTLVIETEDLLGNGRVFAPLALTVLPGRMYLPVILDMRRPDLVVGARLEPAQTVYTAGLPVTLTVIITNAGSSAASNFWVDAYVNPLTVPTQANQTWDAVCDPALCYGLVWFVGGPVLPGQSITVTSTPGSYLPEYSAWLGYLLSGTTSVYVFVDSFSGDGNPNGLVTEQSESNNRADLTGLTVLGPNPPDEAILLTPRELPPARR